VPPAKVKRGEAGMRKLDAVYEVKTNASIISEDCGEGKRNLP